MSAAVIPFARPLPKTPPPRSTVAVRERLRRDAVIASLRTMLSHACRNQPDVAIDVVIDDRGVTARGRVRDASRYTLAGPYAADRIDDFAGIVRAAAAAWVQTLDRRCGMTVVS